MPDELVFNLGDAHLYLNHIDQAKEQISRSPYELPKLEFSDDFHYLFDDLDCTFGEKLDKLRPEMFKVVNYQHHPTIKAPLSN